MSKNICDCPMPPGGRAICEPDQLAICRIKNGHPQTECQDPPAPLGRNISARDYLEWALTEITDKVRLPVGRGLSRSQIAMLQDGVYRDPSTGKDTTFRIPDFVWKKLAAEESEWDLDSSAFGSFGTEDRGRSESR